MNNWISYRKKKDIRHKLATLVDDTLDCDGYYGGIEVGEISEAEAERTYHVLASLIYRLSNEWE